MNPPRRHPTGACTAGFTLTEILVALAVLSIALLPLLATFRTLLRTEARLDRGLRLRMALEQGRHQVLLAARAGRRPEPVRHAWIRAPDAPALRRGYAASRLADAGESFEHYRVRMWVTDADGETRVQATIRVAVPESDS